MEIPEELRPMVEELRNEAASYRKKYAPYRDAFDGFRDEEVGFLLNLVAGLKAADPTAAAKTMRDVAFDMLGEKWTEDAPWSDEEPESSEKEEAPMEGVEVPEDKAAALTADEIQRILDERDKRAQQAKEEEELTRLVEQVKAEAQTLGYEPDSPDYFLLVNTAMHKTDGDLSQAAAMLAPITGIGGGGGSDGADDTAGTAPGTEQAAAPRFPPPFQGGAGAAPGEPKEGPKNVKEARAAMEEWLSSQSSTPITD